MPEEQQHKHENGEQPNSQQASNERSSDVNAPENRSLFGRNGRWLWFGGGVFLVLIGVVLAWLFNMRKPAELRNDAVMYAVYGMIIGVIINMFTLYSMGGMDLLMGTGAGAGASSSGGSIF